MECHVSTIGRFLQAKEPLFDQALYQLEQLTGKKGVDVKLAAEIAQLAADRIKRLGLTPDCSGPELYEALIKRVQEHDRHLAGALGGKDPENIAEMIPLIVKAAQAAPLPKDGWFLKEEVARDMLKKHPPLAVMERLGYHLVSQLLEKENVYELFLALRFAENADWLNQFDAFYQDLRPGDFEPRQIRVVPFDRAKWGDIAVHFIQKKRHNITHSKEMGAIAIMPLMEERMPGVTLKILPLLLHYYNEIRLYSTYFKLMKGRRDFGKIIATTLIADTPDLPLVEHGRIHWRVVQRYFAKLKEPHPEIFEPHVQPEDLHWRRAEEVLFEIDPELEFWRGLDYVAVLKGQDTVTFALMDVSLSYSNGLAYAERYIYHFRESLWNEVFARYLGEPVLQEQLLAKLDSDMIKPELLGSSASQPLRRQAAKPKSQKAKKPGSRRA